MNNEIDKQKMFGFVYLTTNNVNGRKYIGQRIYHPDNPKSDEAYLGSGNLIRRAIKKYGHENFSRVVLEECSSQEELNECEIKWIAHYGAVESREFYNIARGGGAGDTWSGRSDYSKRKFRRRISESNKTRKLDPHRLDGEKNPAFGRHWYKDAANRKQYYLHEDDPLISELGLVRGMFRTKKHNEKIAAANKGKKKNYAVYDKGKISVSKDGSIKFIPPDELDKYLADGYVRGMSSLNRHHKIFMNNGIENKLVDPRHTSIYLSKGYVKGRLVNIGCLSSNEEKSN